VIRRFFKNAHKDRLDAKAEQFATDVIPALIGIFGEKAKFAVFSPNLPLNKSKLWKLMVIAEEIGNYYTPQRRLITVLFAYDHFNH